MLPQPAVAHQQHLLCHCQQLLYHTRNQLYNCQHLLASNFFSIARTYLSLLPTPPWYVPCHTVPLYFCESLPCNLTLMYFFFFFSRSVLATLNAYTKVCFILTIKGK
ncbi:hypothetical protein Pelo_17372 [Pelomyxa schiedti]|nr:hypothetical protein Pelo_17372 [Pelomyxa schiedti]